MIQRLAPDKVDDFIAFIKLSESLKQSKHNENTRPYEKGKVTQMQGASSFTTDQKQMHHQVL